MKYLGVPLGHSQLRVADWDMLEAKFIKKCGTGLGSTASSGGRLVLLNANLSSISFYYMSMFLLPKTVIKRLDVHRRRFFWQSSSTKKRYYMVRWDRICRSKKRGCLGVKNLHRQNGSLLVKWWWKLEKYKGLWQDVIKAKYLQRDSIASVKEKFHDSPCWKAILRVKAFYMLGRNVRVNSGNIAQLWLDKISDGPPLGIQFKELFDICTMPDCTMVQGL